MAESYFEMRDRHATEARELTDWAWFILGRALLKDFPDVVEPNVE